MKYPIGTKLMVCCIPGLDIPVEVTIKSFEYIIKDNSKFNLNKVNLEFNKFIEYLNKL